jgi:hypothetical protein
MWHGFVRMLQPIKRIVPRKWHTFKTDNGAERMLCHLLQFPSSSLQLFAFCGGHGDASDLIHI